MVFTPSPGDLPNPGSKPASPVLAGRLLTIQPPRVHAKNWPAGLVICSHPTSFVTRTTKCVQALRPDLHSRWPPVPYWDRSPVTVPACFSNLLLSIEWSAFSKPLFQPSIGPGPGGTRGLLSHSRPVEALGDPQVVRERCVCARLAGARRGLLRPLQAAPRCGG